MSIDDELLPQPTITKGDRALALFTDRCKLTRRFAEYLNEDSPRKKILFLHGDGGNGKSLLLKHFQQNICKRLTVSDWQQVKTRTDAELAEIIKTLQPTECLSVPSASLDFGLPALGDVQPQDWFYGLLLLRKALGESASGNTRLKFPRYDFACIWYLSQKGKSIDEIKSLFPLNEVAGLATTALDAVTGNPLGAILKASVDFAVQGWSEKLTQQFARLGVDKETQNCIRSQDLDRELVEMLPELFAEDLNAAMQQPNAPKRIVLFFDTHEALWGRERNLPSEIFFYRDEWLRRLLRKLDLENGIVAVVAGRDRPRWNVATKKDTRIPLNFVDLQKVGHLSRSDALAYLQKARIADAELSQSLIDYASVQSGEVHPLYLGLGADVVLQAQSQGTMLTAEDFRTLPEAKDKAEELIKRLLKYVDQNVEYAIRALSACRAFNFDLYQLLGEALHFSPFRPDFDLITGFSFVWQTAQRGQDWYRIHDLLRRLNDQREDDLTQQAHRVLEQYYREQGDIPESIYHSNRLDWEKGAVIWNSIFIKQLESSHYKNCRSLLEIKDDLIIESDFMRGSISQSEGEYFARCLRYNEALPAYKKAFNLYAKELELHPKNAKILIDYGNILSKIGDLLVISNPHLNDLENALEIYESGISAYEKSLDIDPGNCGAINNLGNANQNLGRLQLLLNRHSDALCSFKDAIKIYNNALRIDPQYAYAFNNKGNVLQCLCQLKIDKGEYLNALKAVRIAIIEYSRAIKIDKEYIDAFNNKGSALRTLGDLQEKLFSNSSALNSYNKAVTEYNCVLDISPFHLEALINKGHTFLRIWKYQTLKKEEDPLATTIIQSAIDCFTKVLEVTPNNQEIRGLCSQLQELLRQANYTK